MYITFDLNLSTTLTLDPLLVILIDVTAIKMAIRNGVSDEVEGLLGTMNDAEITHYLASTYGQGRDFLDDDGLYEGTTPVIHAARSGNPDIFASIIRAMRTRLDLQLVRRAVLCTRN